MTTYNFSFIQHIYVFLFTYFKTNKLLFLLFYRWFCRNWMSQVKIENASHTDNSLAQMPEHKCNNLHCNCSQERWVNAFWLKGTFGHLYLNCHYLYFLFFTRGHGSNLLHGSLWCGMFIFLIFAIKYRLFIFLLFFN